ncbi:MAG TPA: SDR family oxidoreductase [Acidimicrobiales bacterium]|nr:SDR family oxidoreductase [Acidimicrobiales bacterium]
MTQAQRLPGEVRSPAELFSLAGKVVLLSGASSGLGAHWAPVLTAAGADVVVTARRPRELADVADAAGAIAVAGDITVDADRQRVAEETVERFGRIDVLINNAGTAASAPALDTALADFRALVDTDLTAVFALSQIVGAHMVAAGAGSIVNVTSLGADRCLDRYPLAAYSSAKSGLVALTRSLASEWGRRGVRVNAVAPAFFPTRLSGFLEDPGQVAWIEGHTALGRAARLDELDGAVLFLASDASSYITGQHLYVDGGWSVY